jgi:hypothetical protein
VLVHHVVGGDVSRDQAMEAGRLVSRHHAPLAVADNGEALDTVSDAPVLNWDLRAANGRIHTLARVIPLPVDAGRGTCAQPIPVEGYGVWIGDTADGLPTQLSTCGDEERDSLGGRGAEQIFSWTAPGDGAVCFSTAGSAFDTVLHARETVCSSRRFEIICNDDANRSLQSAIQLDVDAGNEYFILVDGYQAATTGRFMLEARVGACN